MNNLPVYIVCLAVLFSSMIIGLLSVPMMAGDVKPNNFYGIRLPASFKKAGHWAEINEYGGRVFLFWSVFQAVLALVALAFFRKNKWTRVFVLCLPLANLIAFVQTCLFSSRL